MRMRDAARFFDRNPAYDGYTGAFVFNCAYTNFDDASGDGGASHRQTLPVAPDLAAPTRRCITLGRQRWLLGDSVDEAFGGDTTRQAFHVKRSTDLLAILTPAQACAAAAGTSAYAEKVYLHDTMNTATDAEHDSFWNVFFADGEPAAKGAFLRDAAGVLYRVRHSYRTHEGFTLAQSDELDADAYQAAVVFQTGAYDPVSDSYGAGTVTTAVLQFEPVKFYRFELQADAPVKAGDKMVFVAASALTPKPGVQFTMLGKLWQAVTVKAEQDAYAILARLA